MTYLDYDLQIEHMAASFRVDVNYPAGQAPLPSHSPSPISSSKTFSCG